MDHVPRALHLWPSAVRRVVCVIRAIRAVRTIRVIRAARSAPYHSHRVIRAIRAAPRVLRSAPRTLRPCAPCPAPLVPRTLFSSPRAYAFARCAPRLAEIAVSLSKISFFRNLSKKDYSFLPLRRQTIFFRKKSRKR